MTTVIPKPNIEVKTLVGVDTLPVSSKRLANIPSVALGILARVLHLNALNVYSYSL